MSFTTLKYLWLIEILFVFTTAREEAPFSDVLQRERRQLLFPNVTLLQCNFGVGTPSPHKQINVNWAIQTNFNLPWNLTQIPLDILHANSGYVSTARKKREVEENDKKKKRIERFDSHDDDSYEETVRREREINMNDMEKKRIERFDSYDDDAKLHHFYKFAEDVLNGFGFNGTSCVLRTLCQLAAEPLHTDDGEDLLHEIASYLFNPTNTAANGLIEEDTFPYIEAYDRGKAYQDCVKLYDCTISIADWFSYLAD